MRKGGRGAGALFVLALAACGGQRPRQGPRPSPDGRDAVGGDSVERAMFSAWRAAQMPSVYALIGARERLQLSSAQVTALDSIAEAVREQNRPFADSLARFTRTGSGGPVQMPRNQAQQRDYTAILQRIGANNRAALASIQALLSPAQRDSVCALAREQRPERFAGRGGRGGFGGGAGGRGGMGARRGGMGGAMRGDSLGRRFAGAGGWPWCGPPRRMGTRPGEGPG